MSFLDNLENNLKSLESSEQAQEDKERQHRARQQEAERVRSEAPFADQLKNGPFTADLLKQAARVGFTLRTKVHIAWLGTTLRLEAREHRLELRPTPTGIVTVYLRGGEELRQEPLDLKSSAEDLVRNWLSEAAA
jgi:hypothetical protein